MSMIMEWLDSLAKVTIMPDVMNCRFRVNKIMYEGFIADYDENGILFSPNKCVSSSSHENKKWFPFIHIYDFEIGSIKDIFPDDWNYIKRMRKE